MDKSRGQAVSEELDFGFNFEDHIYIAVTIET